MSLEKKLLARLGDPAAIAEVWDMGVRAEVFEEPLYQAIFNFIIDYWLHSQMKTAPTPFALTTEFPGYTVTDDAEEETGWLALKIQQRAVVNRLQNMMRGATDTMFSDPVGTLKELHAAAYATAEAVAPRNLRSDMTNVEARRQRYGHREDHPQGLGVPYGIDLLDIHTGGILPGELAVVGAVAKTGKTMALMHAAAQAVRRGHRPLVYTLEMSIKECEDRIDAMFSGVSYNRLSRGQLTIEEGRTLYDAQEELRSLGGIHVERPEEGDRTVISLCARARQLGADYLIIDQLSYMEPGQRVQNLKEHHSIIMKQLKTEVSRGGAELPCLLAVQANRDSLKDGLTLQSFANATEIEATVDLALGLSRTQDMRTNHVMRMDVLGSRRSDTTSYLLRWELTERTEISALEEIHG